MQVLPRRLSIRNTAKADASIALNTDAPGVFALYHASQIAALLSYLRQLQRTFHVAVLVVHHARKDANATRPGQALRGSSELHGWGDSNLYMRRRGAQLTLSTEHRAAASQDHIPLQLTQSDSVVALQVVDRSSMPPEAHPSPTERVRQALAQLQQPVPVQQLQN